MKDDKDWIKTNDRVNAQNTFNQMPVVAPSAQASDDGDCHDMVHAVQLMHKMAVHCNNLDEVLRDAFILRTAEGKEDTLMNTYHRQIGSRLYRWVMGSEVSFWGSKWATEQIDTDKDEVSRGGNKESSSKEDDAKQHMFQEHMKQIKRDRRTTDELWLSGVVVAVIAVFVISASGKNK